MTQSTPDNRADSLEHTFSKPDPAARRARMRDFQTRLVDRMQAARSGSDTRSGQLGVLIGTTRFLLDLRQAGEIVAVGTITKVPLTQPWFLGLTNIRGSLISVVDFALFQDGAPTVIDKQSRIVAFAPSLSFNSSLLVTRVLGLRNVTDMAAETKTVSDSSAEIDSLAITDVVSRYRDSDSLVWHVLDLTAVIQNPKFLHVGS
jgi:twitching motility protein PilI